jgi:hypothetical protein
MIFRKMAENALFDLLVMYNFKNNLRNGFPIPKLGGKHVSHFILGQIVFKLLIIDDFSTPWRPSWISQNAQGYRLDIRWICFMEGLRT